MNYEKLESLAIILNDQHGESKQCTFIVAPLEDVVVNDHKHAMGASGAIFNYQPDSDEKLGILSVKRGSVNDGETGKPDYFLTRLEHMAYEELITPENEHLINVYDEYIRSHPTRF